MLHHTCHPQYHRYHQYEYRPLVCPLGGAIHFAWVAGADNLVMVNDEETYIDCGGAGGAGGAIRGGVQPTQLATSAQTSFVFPCEVQGTHLFLSSVGKRCSEQFQRVRVQVTDPTNKTASLRATFNDKTGCVYDGG